MWLIVSAFIEHCIPQIFLLRWVRVSHDPEIIIAVLSGYELIHQTGVNEGLPVDRKHIANPVQGVLHAG